ncbi:MAG TPA: YceI family protein [Vicinamibacterales bacterium]|nr:YceI family protein [Vicinamibacterales bacterium]
MRSLLVAWFVILATAAGAQPVEWTIDPGHSLAQFSVRHMLVSNVRGQFDGPTGTVRFDPADPASLRVDATIATRSINTHNADRDRDLRGPEFFDVERYPAIRFTSRRAEAAGPGRLRVIGDLTMRGITREVTLDVEGPSEEVLDVWGQKRIGATATTTLDRRHFGIMYSRLLEGGGAVIGDQVSITIDLELTRSAKE